MMGSRSTQRTRLAAPGRLALLSGLALTLLAPLAAPATAAPSADGSALAASASASCAPAPLDYPHYAPSVGTVRAAMLFVDFPDAPGAAATTDVFAQLAPEAERFYADASYGQLDLEIVPLHGWLRMPAPSSDYPLTRADGHEDVHTYWDLARSAVSAADPRYDFSDIDLLYTVSSEAAEHDFSPAHSGSPGDGAAADGNEILQFSSLGGDIYGGDGHAPFVLAHETGHLLGRPDLYRYGLDYPETHGDVGDWDLMGSLFAHRDFTAYTKHSFGWLTGGRLACLTEAATTTHTLSPITRPAGLKAVMIPTGRSRGVVLEARHPEGADASACSGGLLIARVDGALEQGSIILERAAEDDPDRRWDCGVLHGAPWTAGMTFSDDGAGIEVEVLSIRADGEVTVRVTSPGIEDDTALGFDDDPATAPRIPYDDPVAFAIAVSGLRFADGEADHAVLSRDDDYADSLAGAGLSGTGPLLLTASSHLRTEVADELRRAVPPGAVVYLLGGEGALHAAVSQQVEDAGYVPVRLRGGSRVETALAVADEIAERSGNPWIVGLARSTYPADNPTAGWADSVSAGAWAARDQLPVLLTPSDALHPRVAEWLSDRGVSETALLGGTSALSAAVEQSVPGPRRIAANERAGTAVRIADELIPEPGRRFVIVNGYHPRGWAFGLAVAGWAAQEDAALLLSAGDALPEPTRWRLSDCRGSTVDAVIAGGESSVPESVRSAVAAAMSGCA